ncbi:MAG: GNAT family N-acetyltransferase [Candidatus Kerfeldbacteria bacterium]|nr:GNAT family N-acetyltransferase [Candidatus Kerfeldbacteria bacterium]
MSTADHVIVTPFTDWARSQPTYSQALRSLAKVYGLAFKQAGGTSLRANTLEIEMEREGHRYLVARLEPSPEPERLIGFVSWRPWGEPRHQLAELTHIGVDVNDPEVRGLGRRLVTAMEDTAHSHYRGYSQRGARKIFILTHADNTRAHNLYGRCGYTLEARLPSFFHPGMDELYFSKTWLEHVAT